MGSLGESSAQRVRDSIDQRLLSGHSEDLGDGAGRQGEVESESDGHFETDSAAFDALNPDAPTET